MKDQAFKTMSNPVVTEEYASVTGNSQTIITKISHKS